MAKAAQTPATPARTPAGQGKVAKATLQAGITTTAVTAMSLQQMQAYHAYLAGLATRNKRQERHLARVAKHIALATATAETPAKAE